jgi:hypothetical protein
MAPLPSCSPGRVNPQDTGFSRPPSRPIPSQPTAPATRTTAAAIPTQRTSVPPGPSRPPEQDGITLVATLWLLNRLQVERAKHHYLDDAEAFARDADRAEEDLFEGP